MRKLIKARWRNWAGDTVESLSLRETHEGIFIKSTIASEGEQHFTSSYEIACDKCWRVRKFNIKVIENSAELSLKSDGFGRWSDHSGLLTRLDRAIDIDISATPFTNTLPIRRLNIGEKQSADILVVYVTVPNLDVSTERQRYTCLIRDRRYRFEQIDIGFSREIEVDKNALVLTYPDLFKRI